VEAVDFQVAAVDHLVVAVAFSSLVAAAAVQVEMLGVVRGGLLGAV